jgi:hypothetical protein
VFQSHNGIQQSQSHLTLPVDPWAITSSLVHEPSSGACLQRFFFSLKLREFHLARTITRIAITSEERLVLGAELRDGTKIRGQYKSHILTQNLFQHYNRLHRRNQSDASPF